MVNKVEYMIKICEKSKNFNLYYFQVAYFTIYIYSKMVLEQLYCYIY